MAICVAIIGKDNSPLLIACADPESELKFHYKIHTSLDIIEEKLSNKATAEIRKLYLGLLHSTEEHKMYPFIWPEEILVANAEFDNKVSLHTVCSAYGYATNTKIKFIIVVKTSNVNLRDHDVHSMFKKLHSGYVDILSNPFYVPGDELISKTFQGVVEGIITGTL